MLAFDRDALVCDLAETYGIFDYRALPVPLLATLCTGLRDDSRIKMKMSGVKAAPGTLLLAAATDWLATLVWMQSEDGRKKRNRPRPVLAVLTGAGPQQTKVQAFASGEEFEAARARILEEVKGHGD